MSASKRRLRPARTLAVASGALLAMGTIFAGVGSASTQDGPSTMAEPCQEGWVCVWDQSNGQGNRVDFYQCALEDVRAHGLDRVGSYINNQYDGTVTTFSGPDSSDPSGPWSEQYTSTAFDMSSHDRGHLTYGVQVC
ncbi:peptidase inhibitor family I36 protein [Parasphingorhabdus pacifica]